MSHSAASMSPGKNADVGPPTPDSKRVSIDAGHHRSRPRSTGFRTPHVERRTSHVFWVKLVQVYGLSETGFLTGLQDHEHTPDRLKSCGRPCPGVDLQVVNDRGAPLPAGQHGELIARGANVMRGYWNNEHYADRRGGCNESRVSESRPRRSAYRFP
jgi:acyl-CoA synthetase (AMP-forming)/AMP-acid ligase II